MSKTTASYPTVSSSYLSLGDGSYASVSKDDDTVTASYQMSPIQQETYNYTQSQFLQNLPSISTFLPETVENLNNEVNAYKSKGLKAISEAYTPILNSLKSDIANRFGNLDNSVFLDKLNQIESKRADAMATLAENVASKQSELIDDELNRRYNYLNFLSDYQDSQVNNVLKALNSAQSSMNLRSLSSDTASTAFEYSKTLGDILTRVGMLTL